MWEVWAPRSTCQGVLEQGHLERCRVVRGSIFTHVQSPRLERVTAFPVTLGPKRSSSGRSCQRIVARCQKPRPLIIKNPS
eukprot:3344322-Amphidinium_carterae.1